MDLGKNQTHIAEITGYSSSGAGVCRIDGRAVFVDFALMGEIWEVLILKVTSAATFGKGIRLIKFSPERLETACPVFGKCGGCGLLHMSYAEELRFKLGRVNDAVSRIGGLDFTVKEIIAADVEGLLRYRNKVIYNIGYDSEGRARAGFYRRRSHQLVPIDDCLIQSELSVRAAKALCSFMDERRIPPYDERSGEGIVRHLFLRNSIKGQDAVVVVVAARGFHDSTGPLISTLRNACPELTGLVLCINKGEGNTVLDGEFYTLWGQSFIEDELSGLKFRIAPESFYQVNPPQAEKLYERVLEYASPDGESTVLDLYCGAGTISLFLARRSKWVYGAEIVGVAVENAKESARINGIKNAEFIEGDAAAAAGKLKSAGVRPDSIVVDPPRKGLSAELIDTIAEMCPKRVVYVSCDPATLARDMKEFSKNGYLPLSAAAVDMFPRTAHVECVVLMSKVTK